MNSKLREIFFSGVLASAFLFQQASFATPEILSFNRAAISQDQKLQSQVDLAKAIYTEVVQAADQACSQPSEGISKNLAQARLNCWGKTMPDEQKFKDWVELIYAAAEQSVKKMDLPPILNELSRKRLNQLLAIKKNQTPDEKVLLVYEVFLFLHHYLNQIIMTALPEVLVYSMQKKSEKIFVDPRIYLTQYLLREKGELKFNGESLVSVLSQGNLIRDALSQIYPDINLKKLESEKIHIRIPRAHKISAGSSKAFFVIEVQFGKERRNLGILIGKFIVDEMRESIWLGKVGAGPRIGLYVPSVDENQGLLIVEPIQGDFRERLWQQFQWSEAIDGEVQLSKIQAQIPFKVFDVDNNGNVLIEKKTRRVLIIDHSHASFMLRTTPVDFVLPLLSLIEKHYIRDQGFLKWLQFDADQVFEKVISGVSHLQLKQELCSDKAFFHEKAERSLWSEKIGLWRHSHC